MNWKRGLLLALINVVCTVPLVLVLEARDAQLIRDREERSGLQVVHIRQAGFAQGEEGSQVSFDPCAIWVHYSSQEMVPRLGNLPADVLTGWRQIGRPRWTLASRILGQAALAPTKETVGLWHRVDFYFCLLLFCQWLLVGSFPLIQPRAKWIEPGLFITVCATIASALALLQVVVQPIESLANLPALLASFAWLFWLVLLLWTGIRFLWKAAIKSRKAFESHLPA